MKNLLKFSVLFLILASGCDNKTTPSTPNPTTGATVDFSKVKSVITQRCTTCHSATPSDTTGAEGIFLDTPEQMQSQASRIKRETVTSSKMPYNGNKTGMTQEERALIGTWVDAGAPIK